MGEWPFLSAFRKPFFFPITGSDTWTANEVALAGCIAYTDPGSLLTLIGVLKTPLVQLMETRNEQGNPCCE